MEEQLSSWGIDPLDARALVELSRTQAAEGGPTELVMALTAALDLRRFSRALRILVERAARGQSTLSDYDLGRLSHLRGLVAWRLDGSIATASRAFTNAEKRLRTANSPEASRYLPRVYDTWGQMLHAEGLLADARVELEHALALREADGDEAGLAITLGNLGRLQLDLGDYERAREHLERDLAIVERATPDRTRLRSQLLTHLAACEAAVGRADESEVLATRAASLAIDGGDLVGEHFAELAKGRAMLLRHDADGALAIANASLRALAAAPPETFSMSEVTARAEHLAADSLAASGRHAEAAALYRSAHRRLGESMSAAPMEMAEVLTGLARSLIETGGTEEANRRFREALVQLDATAANERRAQIESELKAHSLDAWLIHAAGRFIGQRDVQRLLAEAGSEGFRGTRKEVVVLFSDLRGFTTLSERLEPESLIGTLNDFLAAMTRCVERFGGTIDKFIGDAVMAVFQGEHVADDGPALAALAMRDELEHFNLRLPAGMPPLAIGIGLHAGVVVAGLIGSPQKREYTIIGDVVNSASRLEGMTKQLGATVLVTDAVVERLAHADRLLLRPLGRFAPKGRASALAVFDVMGERDGSAEAIAHEAEIALATSALEAFRSRRFDQAITQLEALSSRVAGTGREAGYWLLRDVAREHSKTPPSAEWSGEIVLSSK